MGEFKLRELGWSHKRLVWIGNYNRIDQFKKTIQGPLQKDYNKRWGDHAGQQILSADDKDKRIIMNFKNSHGKWITIYDTDERKEVDKWFDDYSTRRDMQTMMVAMENVKGTNKRSIDEFIDILYEPKKRLKEEDEY